jgi:hypothetical protein
LLFENGEEFLFVIREGRVWLDELVGIDNQKSANWFDFCGCLLFWVWFVWLVFWGWVVWFKFSSWLMWIRLLSWILDVGFFYWMWLAGLHGILSSVLPWFWALPFFVFRATLVISFFCITVEPFSYAIEEPKT